MNIENSSYSNELFSSEHGQVWECWTDAKDMIVQEREE